MPKLTKQAFEKISNELKKLKEETMPRVAQEYQSAVADGDGVHDNPMYRDKKYEMERLLSESQRLENIIRAAEVIDTQNFTKVEIGSTITVKDLSTNQERIFKIISPEESGITIGGITPDSPMGKSLMGEKVNQKVEVSLPNGSKRKYLICNIT